MNKTECLVFFSVQGFGNDPSIVTKTIGAKPDEAWAKGEQYVEKSRKAVRAYSDWRLYSGCLKSDSLEYQLQSLLKKLEPLRKGILNTAQNFNAMVRIVLYVSTANVGFHLSPETIARLSSLGLSADFDIYCLSKKRTL